jgi:hypothetical protein
MIEKEIRPQSRAVSVRVDISGRPPLGCPSTIPRNRSAGWTCLTLTWTDLPCWCVEFYPWRFSSYRILFFFFPPCVCVSFLGLTLTPHAQICIARVDGVENDWLVSHDSHRVLVVDRCHGATESPRVRVVIAQLASGWSTEPVGEEKSTKAGAAPIHPVGMHDASHGRTVSGQSDGHGGAGFPATVLQSPGTRARRPGGARRRCGATPSSL